jgi:hypothetical protein
MGLKTRRREAGYQTIAARRTGMSVTAIGFTFDVLRFTFQAMKSYEVIRQATDEPGVKAVAAALGVSAALVYKWCEPPEGAADPDASGAKNPLDRVREMYEITRDIRLIRYLCNEANGFFVTNPKRPSADKSLDENIFTETRTMVREFSELLDTVTESVEKTPGIQQKEAEEIRQKWEDLKTCVERFARGCEAGYYGERNKT